MKHFVMGIRRADTPVAEGRGQYASTVWSPSMAAIAAMQTKDNRAMPCLIQERKPKSLTKLAEPTGRQAPNLSRTLRMTEGYGLVTIEKNVRKTQPIALVTEFLVVLNDPAASDHP